MTSMGITPKTGRVVIAAFFLLSIIWSFRYFNPFVTSPRFAKLPRPPQGDVPKYPKIEDLTTAAEQHDHNNSNKSWFFGAVGDAAIAVEESLEWFRLSPSQSVSIVDPGMKTKQSIAVATPTARIDADPHPGNGTGLLAEYVAPANISTLQTTATTTYATVSSSVTDTHESNGGMDPVSAPMSTSLILYAYAPATWALPNLNFFLKHGLHGSATFVFVINGALVPSDDAETSYPVFKNSTDSGIQDVLRVLEPFAEKYSNVQIWKRPNTCYDLGAYAEVLKSNSSALVRAHEKFILINASLRGPFVPFWSQECWSDAYLRLLDATAADSNATDADPVKLVGMTINCVGIRPRHIQSMILATDQVGMNILLGETGNTTDISASNTTSSSYTKIGIDACPTSMDEAINIEVSLTSLIQSHNYTVRAMMAEYWSQKDYELDCTNGDINAAKGAYEGGDLGVFETLFIKTRWAVEADQTERLTQWYDGAVDSGMSRGAWDKCG